MPPLCLPAARTVPAFPPPPRGATQVILLKNLDPAAGLVNGSRGVVVGFEFASPPGGGGAPVAGEDKKEKSSLKNLLKDSALAAKGGGEMLPLVRFSRTGMHAGGQQPMKVRFPLWTSPARWRLLAPPFPHAHTHPPRMRTEVQASPHARER